MMKIPLKYTLSQEMVSLISQIEAKKALIENTPIPEELATVIQRQSLLKSSLYSAKIEGNSLSERDLNSLGKLGSNLKERIEVENILSAFGFLRTNFYKEIDKKFILDLHKIVLNGLSESSGKVRTEPSAIFNQAGFAVYMPHPPSQMNNFLDDLVNYINNGSKENVLIKAALTHVSFEKIHPFLDGNGRVGRLLYQALLAKEKYNFNWLLSIEEEINLKKDEYYAYLDKNDSTAFIEFSLDVLLKSAEKVLDKLSGQKINDKELSLLPRRKEILDLIRDHNFMSMDSIRRRFLIVSPRMIRFDLKKLEEEGLIIKVGATRGAMYRVK